MTNLILNNPWECYFIIGMIIATALYWADPYLEKYLDGDEDVEEVKFLKSISPPWAIGLVEVIQWCLHTIFWIFYLLAALGFLVLVAGTLILEFVIDTPYYISNFYRNYQAKKLKQQRRLSREKTT